MNYLQGIVYFDISVMIFMLVLAYLSGKLGEAMKIPPIYKILYVTAFMVFFASILESFAHVTDVHLVVRIALVLRLLAGFIACGIVLRYWMWVFNEFFKH